MLYVLSGAIFLEGMDVSMMGVALPAIRSDLGLSTGTLQWVVSAYVLGYGGFVLLGGRAADTLGRRRMFLVWLGVFIVFSGVGGLATEGWMLIVARFATGVGAGFLAPAGLSIITTGFTEGRARNQAVLVYAGMGGAGFALGLVVGGLLTAIGWRWVFFAPVLVAGAILAAAIRLLPRAAEPARSSAGFDLRGAVGVTGSMLLFVYTIVRAPDVPLVSTATTLAASLGLLAAFVMIEQRSPSPLVRLGIFRSEGLLSANIGALLFVGSFVAFQFIAVLYLQELRDWSALETGLALLVAGVDALLAPTVTPRLVQRFGTARMILAGMILAAVAYGLFLRVQADWTYAAMLPTMVLVGVAFSLAYGALTIAATEGVAAEDQGLAAGLLSMSVQFGAATGLAVATAVNVAATDASRSSQALLDGYRAALVVPVAATVLGAAVAAFGPRRRDRATAPVLPACPARQAIIVGPPPERARPTNRA